MLYSWEFSEHVSCSLDEMEECYKTVKLLINLSDKARRQGLLSLEEDIVNLESRFFQRGLQLVVDGTDPEIIKQILELQIFSRGYRGKELLESCIIYEGVLAIQQGYNPRIVEEILHSFFTEEYQQKRVKRESEKYRLYLSGLSKKTADHSYSEFEELLLSLDDRAIQKILREVDTYCLGIAMSHLAGPVNYRIFTNMSDAAGILLKEDMDYIGEVSEKQCKEEQDKLFNIIAKLEEQGEIIVKR